MLGLIRARDRTVELLDWNPGTEDLGHSGAGRLALAPGRQPSPELERWGEDDGADMRKDPLRKHGNRMIISGGQTANAGGPPSARHGSGTGWQPGALAAL